MPRIVRTARGELIDLDVYAIKQQLAQQPMKVEVSKRKNLIELKDGKKKDQQATVTESVVVTESVKK